MESRFEQCLPYFMNGETNCAAIGRATKIPDRTVRRCFDLFQKTKGDKRIGKSRSVRKLTANDRRALIGFSASKQLLKSSDMAKRPEECRGVFVSPRTIRRTLNKLGMTYEKPKSKIDLKPYHKRARLQFTKKYESQDWSKVILSHKATLEVGPVSTKGEASKGSTVKYPEPPSEKRFTSGQQ